jgi:hypothetical protein
MSRLATLSLALSLGLAACAHDHALDRGDIGGMKNESPAISPWSGPVPSDPIAPGITHAALIPDFQQPSLGEIADRMHTMAVQVVASADGENVNAVSGVLVGKGIVLTDLGAVVMKNSEGVLQPAGEIAVLTAKGMFGARIVDAALDVNVAVLELPRAARLFEGPPLAEGPSASGDRLLAIRASKQGAALLFEAIGFSIERAGGEAHQLQATTVLPIAFAGAPVFDARGSLAGLLVSPGEQDGLLVPAARLREILARVRTAEPQVDDHI